MAGRNTGGEFYRQRPPRRYNPPAMPQAPAATPPASLTAASGPGFAPSAPPSSPPSYPEAPATAPAALAGTRVGTLSAADSQREKEFLDWKRKQDYLRQGQAEDREQALRDRLDSEAREDARYWERHNASKGAAFPNMSIHTKSYRSGGKVKFRSDVSVSSRDASRNARFGNGAGYANGSGNPFAQESRPSLGNWMPIDTFEAGRTGGSASLPKFKKGDFGLDRVDRVPQAGRFQGGYLDPAFRERFMQSRLYGINPSDQRTYYRAKSAAEREWSQMKSAYDTNFQNYGRAVLQRQVDEDRSRAIEAARAAAQAPGQTDEPPPQPVTPGATSGEVPETKKQEGNQ